MSHKELTKYFERIVSQPPTKKESSMLWKDRVKECVKSYFSPITSKWWTDKFSFVEEPKTIVIEPPEDTWSFSMHTSPWHNDDTGEDVFGKSTRITYETNGTWMEQLDKILDVMSEHYGYNIKEQVYYSVAIPLNIEGEAGYGRCLNDEVLQQLLLSFPEVYELPKTMRFLKGE